MELVDKLIKIRLARGIKQTELERMANLRHRFVHDYEANRKKGIPVDALIRICKALRIKPSELLDDEIRPVNEEDYLAYYNRLDKEEKKKVVSKLIDKL